MIVRAVLAAMIVTAVAGGLVSLRTGGTDRRWVPGVPGAPGGHGGATGAGGGWPRSPATGLAVVIALIYLNQALFTVYVLRVHGGDPSFIARHLPDGWFTLAHGPALESIARTTGWLLVLAAVPALPIRYGVGFGIPYVSVAGAAVVLAAAAGLGARDAAARAPGRSAPWLVQMTAAAIAGLCAAGAAAMLVDAGHTETRLLAAGSAGFLVALSVCAALDRLASAQVGPEGTGGDPLVMWTVHEDGDQ